MPANPSTAGASGPGSTMTTSHAAALIILTSVAALFAMGVLFRKPRR